MKIYLTVYLITALCINAYTCVSLFGDVQVKTSGQPIYNQLPAQPVISTQPGQNGQQQYQYNQQQNQLSQSQMSSLTANVMSNMQNNPAVLALLGLRALLNAGFQLNIDISFDGDDDHKYLDLTTGAIIKWRDLKNNCPQIHPPIQNIPQYPQYQYPTQTLINASIGANANVSTNNDGSLLLGSSLGKPPAANTTNNNTSNNNTALTTTNNVTNNNANKPAVASPWGAKP